LAGIVSSACFGLAQGGTTLGQKLLLVPGLYACVVGLILNRIFTGTSAFSFASMAAGAITSALYVAKIFFLPSFAGVLAGSVYLRQRGTSAGPDLSASVYWRALTAVGIGVCCLFGALLVNTFALVCMGSPFFASAEFEHPALTIAASAEMGAILLLMFGSFFFSGMAAHSMFFSRSGKPSRAERILLSSGLYALPSTFAGNLPENPDHPYLIASLPLGWLMLFLISVAGVQYAEQRQARKAMPDKTDIAAVTE
jgi:hypothetical protein